MLTIEHPLTGAKLQVANRDFSEKMTWEEARRACRELGNGWRLPTKLEIEAMYEQLHKKGQGGFKEACYWSSNENENGNAWAFNFDGWEAGYYF